MRAQHPDGVAADLGLAQDRLHPPGGGSVSSHGQPPERDREPPDRPDPHLLHEQPEHRRRELAGEHERRAGQPGREVVERIAGGEHDPSHAGGAVAHEQLDERPAGVVADEGDVMQVEAVKELGDQPGYPGQRQVSVGVHRAAMRPERQRRCHAPVVGGQVSDRPVPQRGVHYQPVQEHNRGPVAAGVLSIRWSQRTARSASCPPASVRRGIRGGGPCDPLAR